MSAFVYGFGDPCLPTRAPSMKKLFSISALAAAAALAFAGPATAADMPVKAAPPPPPPAIYDWSGLYVGFHEGYLWGTVQDSVTGGFVQTDSDVKNSIAGFHAGYQKEFTGLFGFGGLVLGVEGGLNAALNRNDLSNFTPCANPAFACGITNFHDNWYAGGRLGLAFNLGTGGWRSAAITCSLRRAAGRRRCSSVRTFCSPPARSTRAAVSPSPGTMVCMSAPASSTCGPRATWLTTSPASTGSTSSLIRRATVMPMA